MKKFLIVLLLIVLLIVGGMITMFAMSFNPTTFQNEVISSVQKLSGRDVSVRGTTTVSWTPMPTVRITDIRLENIDKSKNPNMLTIEEMKISIEWASLFKTPLVIKSIELTKPVLLLERLESNRSNFAFPFLLDPKFQLKSTEFMSGGQTNSTKIDMITLKEGRVRYDNQVTGISFDIADIDGQMILDGVQGPFRFDGTGLMNEKNYALSLKTGVFQGTEPVDLSIELNEKTADSKITLNGKMTPTQRDKWFTAVGNFSIGRVGEFAEGLNVSIPQVLAQTKASGSLSLEVGPSYDILKDFIVQFTEGEKTMAFTGTITRHLLGKKPSYEIEIGSDVINIAAFKDVFSKLNWSWLTGETEYPEITVKANVKSIPYGTGVMSDLVLNAQYQKNTLSISDSTVILPGDTKTIFSGMGKIVQDTPLLDLNLDINTSSGQSLINWLYPKKESGIRTEALQQGRLKGRLAIDPEKVSLSLDELKFNDSIVSGIIQRTYKENENYALKLTLNNVNLDTYTGWMPPEKTIDVSELPLHIKKFFEQATWVNGLNMKAIIDIQSGTVFGLPVAQMKMEGQIADNMLRLDSLSAKNVAAADIEMSATLSDVGRSQVNIDGFQFRLETKQLPLLLEKTKTESSLPLITKASDAKISLVLNGSQEGIWNLETQAQLSDANIKLAGSVGSLETTPVFQNLNFDIAHPNFKSFMNLVAPEWNLFPKLDGSFKTKGTFSGTKNRFDVTETRVGVGLQQLTGSLSFDNQKIKTLTFDVSSPSIDIERFTSDVNPLYTSTSGLSKQPFDFTKWDNWTVNGKLNATQLLYGNINVRQAEIDLALQNKELTLRKFVGVSSNSDTAPFEITGKLDWNTTPKLSFGFDIQKLPIRTDFMVFPDFAFGGGLLSVKGNLNTRGVSPAEFAQQLNGQGTLNVFGGQMMGVNIEGMIPIITRAVQRNEGPKIFEPEFKRVLNSGKTVIKDISGDFTVADGIVRMMDLTMKTANATANPTQIIWDLSKRTLDISVPVLLDPLNTLPPFILGVSVTGGRAVYKPNYTDLSASLSNQSQTALANDLRQKEEVARAEIAQKRNDRITQSRELTIDARNALALMEQKIQEYPFEKGKRLLQSASDAMAIVNQLAVREEPTDAQLIQQIEQARIVLLKAEEFQTSMEQETLFNIQKQMNLYKTKSEQMVSQLKAWAEGYPDIVLLGKLFENANKNGEIVQKLFVALKPDTDKETVSKILAATDEAVEKITKAYQHAARFDLPLVAKTEIEGISNELMQSHEEPKGVKGTFKRSN